MNFFRNIIFIFILMLGINSSYAQENNESEQPVLSLENFLSQNIVSVPESFYIWKAWNLVIVSLDKNEKPVDKTEVSLEKAIKISKNDGPQLTIEETSLANHSGRLIRIQCDNNTITQKFDTTNQLKGWATQTSCKKQNYFFIVNPAS